MLQGEEKTTYDICVLGNLVKGQSLKFIRSTHPPNLIKKKKKTTGPARDSDVSKFSNETKIQILTANPEFFTRSQ